MTTICDRCCLSAANTSSAIGKRRAYDKRDSIPIQGDALTCTAYTRCHYGVRYCSERWSVGGTIIYTYAHFRTWSALESICSFIVKLSSLSGRTNTTIVTWNLSIFVCNMSQSSTLSNNGLSDIDVIIRWTLLTANLSFTLSVQVWITNAVQAAAHMTINIYKMLRIKWYYINCMFKM